MKTIRSLLAFIVSMTLSFSAMAQGMCYFVEEPRIIYDDAFEQGWNTFFWGTISAIPSTIAGKSGSTALQVITSTANAGMQIQATGAGPFNTSGHKALTFMLRRETSVPVDVSIVRMIDSTTSVVGQSVVAGSQYSLPRTNMSSNEYGMWQIITIPLSELQATNVSFGGVIFTAGAPTTFYLDKIELTNGFLSFPLDCSNTSCSGAGVVDYRIKGAYTPGSVNSVVDHSMTQVYQAEDGTVLAWTGEKGVGSPTNLGCYPKSPAGTFSLYSTHSGGSCLNYDSHPAFDYKAENSTPVRAADGGVVVEFGTQRCIPKGISTDGCEAWGAVGIDHGNGYITQYLHLSSIVVNKGDPVSRGQIIGFSGNKAPQNVSLGYHLHFEVLKRKNDLPANDVNSYKVVDPYGWYADNQEDPLMSATGIRNSLLWRP